MGTEPLGIQNSLSAVFRARDNGRRLRAESIDQPRTLEFCSEVAVLSLLYSRGRVWQAAVRCPTNRLLPPNLPEKWI